MNLSKTSSVIDNIKNYFVTPEYNKNALEAMWKGRKITGEYKDRVTDYHWNIGGKKEWNHPALKPIEPTIHMLKVGSDEGDVVLDMFMGSGTTGDACLKTNRKFIGIEKNDLFFEMAVKRIGKVFDCLNKNDIKLF